MSVLITASTALSGFSTSTPTAGQSPQPTEEPNSPKIPTTTSLLFGFLVSFLGLFIVFVGWGLASRYMMDRRRERLANEEDLMEGGVRKGSKPPLWDVWTVPGREKWEDMMPLSVELLGTPSSHQSVPLDRHVSFTPAVQLLHWYRGLGRRGFPFASLSRRVQPHDSVPFAPQGSRTPKTQGPLEIQIAVLVAMPSLTSRTRDHNGAMNGKRVSVECPEHNQDTEEMSDVAVGISAIPWDKERMDFG